MKVAARALAPLPLATSFLVALALRSGVALDGPALLRLSLIALGLAFLPGMWLVVAMRVPRKHTLMLLALSAPLALWLGHELSQADGLRARAPAWLLASVGGLLGLASNALFLCSPRLVLRSRMTASFTTAVGALLLACVVAFLPRHRLLLAYLTLPGLAASAALLAAHAGRSLLVLASAPLLCAASLALVPANLRSRVLLESDVLAQLDRVALGWPSGFRGYELVTPVPCAPEAPFHGAADLGLTPAQRRNVLVISIDSLRVDDAFSTHGGKPLMPALGQFFRSAARAEQAYTAYPATMMALGSAFSGILPSRALLEATPPQSVLARARAIVDDVSVYLPRGNYFRREGVARYVLQGARHVEVSAKQDQTNLVIERVKALRAANTRHLLWLHYFEPHAPYDKQKGIDFGPSDRERYRGELSALDVKLGRLFRALAAHKVYDDTLVLVFADHGESFGEHGHSHHHYELYPWLVQVPFAMRVPGGTPRVIQGPVQLADVAATVFDFLGLAPDRALDGRSLLEGDPARDRVVLSEEFPITSSQLAAYGRETPDERDLAARIEQVEQGLGYVSRLSVIRDGMQLLVQRTSNLRSLYDLRDDPGVEHDLASERPEAVRALEAAMDTHFARQNQRIACQGE